MKENIYKQMDKVRPQPISRAPEIKEMKKVKLAKGDLKPTSAIRVHIPQKEKAKLQAKEKVVNTIPDKYAMMPADSLDALNLLKKKEADKKKAQKKKLKKIDKKKGDGKAKADKKDDKKKDKKAKADEKHADKAKKKDAKKDVKKSAKAAKKATPKPKGKKKDKKAPAKAAPKKK